MKQVKFEGSISVNKLSTFGIDLEDMWRGLPSELPAGIDNVNYGSAGRANLSHKGDYITSAYPAITTPFYGAQFTIPEKPLVSDPVITRAQNESQGMTKRNIRGSFQVKLQNADAESERALLESLNTTNAQPRFNYEGRWVIYSIT